MGDKIRIAVLHFAHETVTFLKNDTTLDDFIWRAARDCWLTTRKAIWAAL
jgi:hypothetical protein